MWDEREMEAVLLAVVDRVIPKDEYPSAGEAGGVGFVRGRMREAGEKVAGEVEGGLRGLGERGFLGVGEGERDEMLLKVERERWFGVVCEWVAEGYYADEGNGGNAGGKSWEMVGYDGWRGMGGRK